MSAVYAQSKIVEVPGLKFRETEGTFAPLSKFAGAARSIGGRYVMPGRGFEEEARSVAVALPVALPESMDYSVPE